MVDLPANRLGDREAVAEVVPVVVVRGNAVTAVAVQIQADAVERNLELCRDSSGGVQNGGRLALDDESSRQWPMSRGTATSRSYICRRSARQLTACRSSVNHASAVSGSMNAAR